MSTSELKLELFRKIDSLDSIGLIKVLSFLESLQQPQGDEEWEKLPLSQRVGILKALKSLQEGTGVAHEEVVARVNRKLGVVQ